MKTARLDALKAKAGDAGPCEPEPQDFARDIAVAEQLAVDVHEMVAERDLVAVRATFSGTSQGALMGAQPTGNPIALTSMLFLRLRDGKIVERWEQADLLGLMLQLNIVQQGDSGGEAG